MSRKVKSKVAITKIKNFLEEKSDELPVISISGAHIKIGKYFCLERNGVWEIYNKEMLVKSFTLRNSAIAWAVASLQGQTVDAQQIESHDLHFSRHHNDSIIFHQRYRTATDDFRRDLMYIRYEESEYHKNHIRNQLEESIKKIKIN